MRRSLVPILCCLFALPALAQPAGVSRVVRVIDFEERRLGNDEDLPMHWVKVESPGFPHYLTGKLATDHAHGGTHAFRLDLNGGSILYRYEPNQIRVRAGCSYHVQAYVRTTPLQYARARVSAYFTDLDGHALTSTVRHSDLIVSGPDDPDGWRAVDLDVTASHPDAAYLVMEIGLLQPQVYAPSTLGQRTLFVQDIKGSAWFDDIAVSQVPRVRIGTKRAGNIFRRSDPIAATLELDDAFTDDLAIQLVVRDAVGRQIYQRSGVADSPANTGQAQAARAHQSADTTGRRYDVPLPDLTPGWYEVTVATSSQGHLLASRSMAIVRLPDDEPLASSPDPRFGVIATDLPLKAWPKLAELLPHLGAGRVKLGVWTRAADFEQADPDDFDAALVHLNERHIVPTACLLDLPPTVTRKLDQTRLPTEAMNAPGASWARLLKANDDQWQPALEYLVSRHANHLDRWQIGPDGSDAFASTPGMREVYGRVLGKFRQLLHAPDLAMPWPAWYEMDGDLPATIALAVPSSVLPPQLPLYLQDLKNVEGHHLSLNFQFIERERYGREVQIRDVAQRVVYALAAGAERLDLPLPFTNRPEDEAPTGCDAVQPTELFLILRSLATTLGNARFVGRVPIADGVEAFLFDENGQSTLVMWDTGHEGDRARGGADHGSLKPLPINLGKSPRMLDLWGNEIPLLRPAAEDPATGTVQLLVGPTPTFLTHIDGSLARLRASVTIDRPLIESTYQTHTRHIKFRNTYPQQISGTLKLTGPTGWRITPSTHNFTLNPGEEFDREVEIEFPLNSPAGARTIQAGFAMQTPEAVTFQMPLGIKLGLSDVGMQTMAVRDGEDLVIQQIVQNYGDKPVDYSAFAVFPGKPRQERLVTNLLPGKSIVKRYRFGNVPANVPAGTTVRVGLKEIDGPRLLNDEVEVR